MLPLRHRLIIACTALMAVPLALPSPAAADAPTAGALYTDGPSGRFLLDGTWLRRSDPRDRGIRAGYVRARYASGWSPVTVPDAANAADMSARSYLGGVCWYRKDFESPGGAATNWVLRFESVNYRATVWLNGRRLGRHTGGYLPFEVEAKGMRTGTNRLVVRVDSRRTEPAIPPLGVRNGGKYVGGWWNYAGILREVYLRRVDTFDFVNVAARPRLDCPECDARVYVRAVVANMEGVPARAEVSATVGGQQIRFTPATIQARGFRLFRGSTAIRTPRLWSPDDPAPLQRRAGGLARRPGGPELHAEDRHPQHRARRGGPDAPERPPPEAARGEPARGGPDARRRPVARRHPRELRRCCATWART